MTDNTCRRTGEWGRRLLLGFMLLGATTTFAWNGAGHRLVACIAWDQLDASQKIRVGQLLKAHPDYQRWIRSGDNADRTAFIEASTWADEIRHDPRYYDAGTESPTPPLPGLPDTQRHRDWHYVNRPINQAQSGSAQTGRIEHQLAALKETLASPTRPLSERAYALPWLIHLIGDAHQPLHVGVRLNGRGRWDKQGDGEQVINPFNSRKRRTTLHAFWDDLPGPSWLRRRPLDRTCHALVAMYPRPTPSAPARWLEESWQIAKTDGYPAGDERVPVISAAFWHSASEIARRRITEAGYRLADELSEALVR